MKSLATALILVAAAAACGDDDGPSKGHDAAVPMIDAKEFLDAKQYLDAPADASGVCNPLTQAGCNVGDKCTWLLDSLAPNYVGHIGCAPAGTGMAGDACMYGAPGATGYDGCQKGLVCGDYRGGTGVCKTICDQQGGNPMCGANKVCVTYTGLFSTGISTPAAGGVCDQGCDPLGDNDFDGPGSALTRTGTTCGGSATSACYGYPSFGTPPVTAWSCTSDINYGNTPALVHRVQCTDINNCADPGPTIYVNSCNQGYLPLLRESTTVSTAVCVAMCKPANCYSGNCGTSNDNRLGAMPHQCNAVDARGTFDTSAAAEHCRYIWSFEFDSNGAFLRSPTSDTVGFCFDHTKYLYDSNNDNMPDMPLPACAQLQNGFGSGTNPADPLTYFGASDLGCVDTATGGVMFVGKPKAPRPIDGLRPLSRPLRGL